MSLPRRALPWLLASLALASSFAVWQLSRQDEPVLLVGPPRSDYFLNQFELTALDEAGQEAFSVTGPLLSRHPGLGTTSIDQPRFHFPMKDGIFWLARADQAWASADGGELRLEGNAELEKPDDPKEGALRFRSPRLDVFPKERRASTDTVVEFSSPHSILQGRGFRADLQTRRFQLLDEVIGHYEPAATSRQP